MYTDASVLQYNKRMTVHLCVNVTNVLLEELALAFYHLKWRSFPQDLFLVTQNSVCVCVCESEREREREAKTHRKSYIFSSLANNYIS